MQPQILARLGQNLAELDVQLGPATHAARLETEGGWYAILSLRHATEVKTWNDDDWAAHLARAEGVLVHPGHFYEFASEKHLVLSLLPRPDVFSEGIQRLAARLSGGENPLRCS
jgi:hypothetical protein